MNLIPQWTLMVTTGLAVTSMDEFLTTIKEALMILRIPRTGSTKVSDGRLRGEIKTHGK